MPIKTHTKLFTVKTFLPSIIIFLFYLTPFSGKIIVSLFFRLSAFCYKKPCFYSELLNRFFYMFGAHQRIVGFYFYFFVIIIVQMLWLRKRIAKLFLDFIHSRKFNSLPSFFKLVIAYLVLSPFLIFVDFFSLSSQIGIIFIVIMFIFSWGLAYFLVQRKNWARILLKVLSIIEIVYLLFAGVGVLFFTVIGGFNFYTLLFLLLILGSLAVSIAVFVYFSKKEVKALFMKK